MKFPERYFDDFVIGDTFERRAHVLVPGRSPDREHTDVGARYDVIGAAPEPDLHE